MALTEIDRRLMSQCLERASGAWQDFVDRFIGLFVHVIQHVAQARTVRLTKDDIEDLCSEIFLTLLRDDFAALRRFRGNSSLATYLTVISRRVVVKELSRRKKAESFGHVSSHVYAANAPVSVNGHSDPHHVEDIEEIKLLLNRLPSEDAEVLRRFHLEGKTYHQISEELGIPENTIGSTLSRARNKLQQLRAPAAM